MYRQLMLLCAVFCSGQVYAGSAVGKITNIHVADNSVYVLFMLDSDISNTPRCNEKGRFSISLRKPGGSAAYTAILEAKREGYQVRVEGLNTCSNDLRSEDIRNITLY